MDEIRQFAEKYKALEAGVRNVIDMYVFKDKSLDYYYGMYIASYQIFVMANCAESDITCSIMWLIYAISAKIVQLV